jgi:hypothetical protein
VQLRPAILLQPALKIRQRPTYLFVDLVFSKPVGACLAWRTHRPELLDFAAKGFQLALQASNLRRLCLKLFALPDRRRLTLGRLLGKALKL